jgi:ribonuclease J
MLDLVKPRFFLPIHGEHHMLTAHGHLAESIGTPGNQIIIATNGDIVELDRTQATLLKQQVPAHYLFVNESGAGEVEDTTQGHRHQLHQEGMVTIIATRQRNKKIMPTIQILSRGFVYVKNNQDLFQELTHELEKLLGITGPPDESLETLIASHASTYLYRKTERRPMILPVIIEV